MRSVVSPGWCVFSLKVVQTVCLQIIFKVGKCVFVFQMATVSVSLVVREKGCRRCLIVGYILKLIF